MGYIRLFKRVRIAPGVSLNLSKSGPSVSFGVRGAHLTVGGSGLRKTVGIPGTGTFYTSRDGWHSGAHTGQAFHDSAPELTAGERVAHTLAALFFGLLGMMIIFGFIAALISTLIGS